MSWLSKVLPGRGPTAHPGAVALAAVLREGLGQLSRPDELAAWVVTGHPHDGLTTATSDPAWPDSLVPTLVSTGQTWVSPVPGVQRHALADLPPDVLDRLLDLVETAAAAVPWAAGPGRRAGLPAWTDALVPGTTVLTRALLVDAGSLEDLEVRRGLAAGATLRAYALPATVPSWQQSQHRALLGLPGLAGALARHVEAVRPALGAGDPPTRLRLLDLLGLADDRTLATLAPELAAEATSGNARVRTAARALLVRAAACGPEQVAALDALATDGTPAVRAHAFLLLHELGDDEARRGVRERALADRAAGVRELVERWDAAAADAVERGSEGPGTGGSVDPAALGWSPPVRQDRGAEWAVPLTADVERWVDDVLSRLAQLDQQYSGRRTPTVAPGDARRRRAQLRAHLASTDVRSGGAPATGTDPSWPVVHAVSRATPSGVPLVAVLKALDVLGALPADARAAVAGSWSGPARAVGTAVQRLHGAEGPTLLEVADALAVMGVGAEVAGRAYALRWQGLGDGWPEEHLRGFFACYGSTALDLLDEDRVSYEVDRARLLRGLGLVEHHPRAVLERLVALAVGTRTSDHEAAQDALGRGATARDQAVAALRERRAGARQAAARWCARLGDPSAVDALEAAFRTERDDQVRSALLDALERLGRPAHLYLDPASLAADADKGLRKGVPASLAWVWWDGLPPLRWAADGTELPLPVVQWLCLQAVKARSPEPGAVLRRYGALLEERSRGAFAVSLLQQWVAEDTRPVDPADAEQAARAEAAGLHRGLQQYPGYYPNHPMHGRSLEEVTAWLLPGHLRRPRGSATSSKGVLAVVGATGDERVVPVVRAYLAEWYGTRAAQCKALLGVLAWVPAPAATQQLLQVADRFRTKGVQQEAVRLAQQVADVRGWTTEELADRTVPTAGFDARGEQVLSYGERAFTAVLDADLTVRLRTDDGRTVKALPAPRSSDDAEAAAASKQALAAARKEVKGVLQAQRSRLQQALVSQRTWDADLWAEHVVAHPLVGRLAQGLVWVLEPPGPGTAGDGAPAGAGPLVVRPLPDGSLTDVDDEDVEVPAGWRVRLAHDAVEGPEVAARWLEHLADYEVTPPFPQLGRPVHRPEDSDTDAVTDVRGTLVASSFRLRGRATAAGWARGEVGDGATWTEYVRTLPGWRAELEHSGLVVPEEDHPVALLALRFRAVAPDGTVAPTATPLGSVPAVVYSECLTDVRGFASLGAHDPEWQKAAAW
ncbi:DUF4132 domain-containing protein [Aquipuribacter sp. SD81]|uniref:DUF4132 domain-containing protein n=1 Tax=Aquipuribacter sp. SD81 TaxID=3127703 RepID=UPI003017AAEA